MVCIYVNKYSYITRIVISKVWSRFSSHKIRKILHLQIIWFYFCVENQFTSKLLTHNRKPRSIAHGCQLRHQRHSVFINSDYVSKHPVSSSLIRSPCCVSKHTVSSSLIRSPCLHLPRGRALHYKCFSSPFQWCLSFSSSVLDIGCRCTAVHG